MHAYVLMTASRDAGVSAVVKHIGQRYVQHANRTHGCAGGLFEGRFRSYPIVVARAGLAVDFRLQFESPRTLFAEVTPEWLELLELLRRTGPSPSAALIDALSASRPPRDIAADLARMEMLGLIERDDGGLLSVPFTARAPLLAPHRHLGETDIRSTLSAYFRVTLCASHEELRLRARTLSCSDARRFSRCSRTRMTRRYS